MDLSWLESVLYGFVSGFADILPVSAQAHRILLLKVFGHTGRSDLLQVMIYLGIFAALYFTSQKHLVRMTRALKLSRVPKRRRKRPLDTRSLMDFRFLRTALIPVVLVLFAYRYVAPISNTLLYVVLLLFLNGVILYIPQYMPAGNRDSRTLSRVEGLLMGIGGAAGILPGISGLGTSTAVASVCGVDRDYALTTALMMNMVFTAGMAVISFLNLLSNGLVETLSFMMLLRYLVTALAAFGGTLLAVRILRTMAANNGYGLFGFYCWGMALFTFILNILV